MQIFISRSPSEWQPLLVHCRHGVMGRKRSVLGCWDVGMCGGVWTAGVRQEATPPRLSFLFGGAAGTCSSSHPGHLFLHFLPLFAQLCISGLKSKQPMSRRGTCASFRGKTKQ